MKNLTFALLFALTSALAMAQASPPPLINYQGVLRNAAGAPLDASVDAVFRLYDDPAAGNLLWEESWTTVTLPQLAVSKGLFNIALGDPAHRTGGSQTSLAAVFSANSVVYLGVRVGADAEMTPRVRVVSAAYAQNSDALDGMNSTAFAAAAHPHAGADITTGTVAEARIDAAIARDSEILPTVLASDGTGSTLDADLLDGLNSAAFLASGGKAADAELFDGIDSANFLRGDVADTAAGVITFTAATTDVRGSLVDTVDSEVHVGNNLRVQGGTVGVGVAPDSNTGIDSFLSKTTTSSVYGASIAGWNNDTGTGNVFGTTATGYANGTSNAKTVYGLYALGAGTAAGTGTRYGVYATASGGATNWGLYTPNNAFVGGMLDFGAGANDYLIATYVTDLTDGTSTTLHTHPGADATTLDGLDSLQFLRSDVADTAAGVITFSAATTDVRGSLVDNDASDTDVNVGEDLYVEGGNIGVGIAPSSSYGISSSGSAYGGLFRGTQYGSYGYVIETSASTLYGAYNSAQNDDTGSGGVWGTYGRGYAGGASNAKTVYGLFGIADGAVGTGTRYGVYGTASGGAINWGLYTPNNAFVGGLLDVDGNTALGNAATDTLAISGTAISVAGATVLSVGGNPATMTIDGQNLDLTIGSSTGDEALFYANAVPAIAATGASVGTSVLYWNNIYGGDIRYKTLALFDVYPDLDLIDAMKGVQVLNSETGTVEWQTDPATIPSIIRGTPTPDDPAAGQFIDAGRADGLLFGAIREQRREAKGRDAALRHELDLRTPDKETGTQEMKGNLQIVLDKDASGAARFSVFGEGEDSLAQELLRLDERGNLRLKGALMPNALDLAEYHPVSESVEPGDVLVADRATPGMMRRSAMARDKAVVGIVSTSPGVALGAGVQRLTELEPGLAAQIDDARARGDKPAEDALWVLLERRFEETHAAIALSGTVLCKVDAAYGAVEVGDLLVTSPTPGHAMRSDDPSSGTIIGKALEPLDAGIGLVKVLVMLR